MDYRIPERQDFSPARVLVVGDVMLDRYWFGDVSRISPEAPVPVARITKTEHRAGGAANVARNIAALGGQAALLAFCGKDDAADTLEGLMRDNGVAPHLERCPGFETTLKLRVLARQQQLISAIMRELQSKNYVTDLPSLVSFLQAAIATVNISSNLADPMADATLLVNLMSKLDRANMQFVTLPVVAPPWDENRRITAEPLASKVWQAIEDDQALPVGTEYTDGNGAHLTVPDPNAGSSSAPGAGDSSQGQGASPSAPGQGAAPSNPGQGSEDSTSSQTDVAQANNSAEAEAKNQVDTCPPADKR